MAGGGAGWRLLTGALLVTALLPAAAQTFTIEPTAAQRCLAPAAEQRGLPAYPFEAWKREHEGSVVVALLFTAPERAPEVQVLSSQSSGPNAEPFIAAVREHVATWRVPCLSRGDSSPLHIEFVFKPSNRQVFSSPPLDPGLERKTRLTRCIVKPAVEDRPEYPMAARKRAIQGRLLARVRFDSADKPPTYEVMSTDSGKVFRRSAEILARGLRMPCFDNEGPVEVVYTFVFELAGMPAFGLKPTDLPTFMSVTAGIQQQHLQLDTTRMGCPFDVQFQYRRPYFDNRARHDGQHLAAREPLLRWLETATLDLSHRDMDAVFADSTVITVPCLNIDLKPKETS